MGNLNGQIIIELQIILFLIFSILLTLNGLKLDQIDNPNMKRIKMEVHHAD